MNSPRRFPSRMPLIAFVAGAGLAAGVAALAHESGGLGGWHHGMMTGAPQSAADVSAHVDHMLKHLYRDIDATDAQRAQITPLVQQAVSDLLPLRSQLEAAHAEAVDGLTRPTVDRSALEAARAVHLQLADQASKRFTQLIADVGDVLTPTQRNALANHLRKMRGMTAS